jgi:hypothetical protein
MMKMFMKFVTTVPSILRSLEIQVVQGTLRPFCAEYRHVTRDMGRPVPPLFRAHFIGRPRIGVPWSDIRVCPPFHGKL